MSSIDPVDRLMGVVGDEKYTELVDGERFTFKRLAERKPGESWTLLYYGPSKAGKTWFAGTAGSRTLIINIGYGLETLLSPKFRNLYPDHNPITVDITEGFMTAEANAFDIVGDTIDHAMKNFRDKFDTVVVDEATALRRIAMNKAIEFNRKLQTRGPQKKPTEDFVAPEIQDYGREMQMIEWFLATYMPIFKKEGLNFLMLAHERLTYAKPPKIGDEPVLKKITPGFTGKTFPDQVPAYFDDVWHAEVIGGGDDRTTVYRARTAGDEMQLGGSRHAGIFSTVERDPNYLKMLERIKNSTRK